jgi:hypothetical protein
MPLVVAAPVQAWPVCGWRSSLTSLDATIGFHDFGRTIGVGEATDESIESSDKFLSLPPRQETPLMKCRIRERPQGIVPVFYEMRCFYQFIPSDNVLIADGALGLAQDD